MTTVLLATLGESPLVVYSVFNVLVDQGIAPDVVKILYPEVITERWIELGCELLVKHLSERVSVQAIPLPFADANTEEDSFAFLQIANSN